MIFAHVCGQKTLQQSSIGPVIQGAVSRFCHITFTTDIHAPDSLCTYFSDPLQTFQHRIQAHVSLAPVRVRIILAENIFIHRNVQRQLPTCSLTNAHTFASSISRSFSLLKNSTFS